MKTKFKTMIAAGVAALTLQSGAALAQSLEWTTGQLGGGWYGMGGGLATLVMEKTDLNIKVVPGGGKDNPAKLEAGLSQIGMGLDFLAFAAVNGNDPYPNAHGKVMAIGKGWSDNPFHFVRADDQTLSLEEALTTDGLRIGVTKTGSSEELTFTRVMDYYGTSYDKIREGGGKIVQGSYSDLVNAFKDGQIDYLFIALGLPGAAVIEISQSRRDAELVPFPQDVIDHLSSTYGYAKGSIPAGTYDASVQDGELAAPVMGTILIASSDVPEDTVYTLTKALLENQDRFGSIHSSLANFKPESGWDTTIPMHPGALKAYEELGYK
ncbi:TAXI family TRAP transporter solute-binding subunit [Ruegeria sp.]|uniref:TAXI family TRAP transporter solute-binding subunit n=1 Tax=Ruegeria sp. TaxID=1879320 RepID=UPI003B59DAF4